MIQSHARPEATIDVNLGRERCVRMRKRILELSQGLPAIHIGGAFSCLELVDTIYFSLMQRDAANQLAEESFT